MSNLNFSILAFSTNFCPEKRVERTTGEILWVTLIDANLLESTVAESVKLSFIRWSFFNSTGGQQPRRLLEAAEEDGRIFHLYLTLFKRMMAGGHPERLLAAVEPRRRKRTDATS